MIPAQALWPTRYESGFALAFPDAVGLWPSASALVGAHGWGNRTPAPLNRGACFSASFADVIYNQLHLFPSLLELGLLSGAEARDVLFWNAFMSPVELLRIDAEHPAGTELLGMQAGTLAPTQEARGTLNVLASGPAQQNTSYAFVTSLGELSFTVTASRVLLFPFWPDWGEEVSVEYRFDTVLSRSENGREQRRPLVIRPLRRVGATIWGDEDKGQRLHHFVQQAKDRVVGVPLWQEALSVTSISASRTVLTLGGRPENCWNLHHLCDLVMAHDTQSGWFAAVSLRDKDLAAGTLTVTSPLGYGFSPGTTRVVPLFPGIVTGAEPRTVSSSLELWRMDFEELAGSQPELVPVSENPADWVLPFRPDWSGSGTGGTSALLRTLRTVRGGVTELGSLGRPAPVALRQEFLLRGAELTSFLEAMTALRGRWKAFRVRDPRRAFTLTRPAKLGWNEVYVLDNGVRDVFKPGMAIWMAPPSGKAFSRRIQDVGMPQDGELILYLDGPHPADMPRNTHMGREYAVRLDTDSVTVRHLTANVARCALSFYELTEES